MSACKKMGKRGRICVRVATEYYSLVDYDVVCAATQDGDHHHPHHIMHHYGVITNLARVLLNIRISCDLEFRCSSTTTSNL